MSRYVETHAHPDGAGDARPTALQIIKDEGLEGNMKDMVFLVTGAAVSIGAETARAFAATGGKVYLAVRNFDKAQENCKDFLEPGRVELLHMDNADLSSVRKCAAEFLKRENKLNVLVSNAGIMMNPTRGLTKDGFEEQFGVNYISHFLLFILLKDALIRAATPDFHSRVVNVSSSGHWAGGIEFGNYTLEGKDAEGKEIYNGWRAYGQSKTAMIYMTNEIERRYAAKGIHGYSLMPGGIKSDLQRHMDEGFKETWDHDENIRPFMKSPGQGASTQVIAAVGKEYEKKGGRYLEDCVDAKEGKDGQSVVAGYSKHIFDKEKAERLWVESLEMVGEKDDQQAGAAGM